MYKQIPQTKTIKNRSTIATNNQWCLTMSREKHLFYHKEPAQNNIKQIPNMLDTILTNIFQRGLVELSYFVLAVRVLCEPVWLTTKPPAPSPHQTQSVNDSSPLCKYDFPNQLMQTKCGMHVPSGSQGTAWGTNTDSNTWWAPPMTNMRITLHTPWPPQEYVHNNKEIRHTLTSFSWYCNYETHVLIYTSGLYVFSNPQNHFLDNWQTTNA